MNDVRVLVAEDDPRWQSAIWNALRSLNGEVQVVGSYEKAVECVKEKGFDLVIVDLRLDAISELSEISGMELLREIRNSKYNRQCAVIIITGHSTTELELKARDKYQVFIVIDKSEFTFTYASKNSFADIARSAINKSRETTPQVQPIASLPARFVTAFLCHSKGDKKAVRELYEKLKKDEVEPWLDEEDILPGQDWDAVIKESIKKSDVIIVCLSLGSVDKQGYVQKEISFALDQVDERPEGTIYIIPAKLEECDLPKRLSKWQFVNLFEDQGYGRLIRSLKVHFGTKEK